MLYSSLYDDQNSFELEISKDYEKFSTFDIDFCSSTSFQPQSKKNKTFLKDLLNDNIDEYINLISVPYNSFKQNHNPKSKYSQISSENANIIYQTNTKIIKSVENNYFTNEKKFRIKSEILEQKKSDMKKTKEKLIQKNGSIEIELKKILLHSSKIENFINSNLIPFNERISLFSNQITNLRRLKTEIKKKYIINEIKTILKGTKRKNLLKIYYYFSTFKKLKETLALLKILATNRKKFKIAFDLISKAKSTLDKLKRGKKNNLNILSLFDNDINSYQKKVFDQMNNEFNDTILEYFKNFVTIEKETNNTPQFFTISQYVYDMLTSSSYGANNIIKHVTFGKSFSIIKIKMFFQLYIKNNILDSFYIKIGKILKKTTIDIFNDILNKLNNEVNKEKPPDKTDSKDSIENQITIIADSEKNSQSVLLCLIQAKIKMIDAIKVIIKEFQTQIANSNSNNDKKTEKIKKNFNEELDDIIQLLIQNLNNIIHNNSLKCLNELLNHTGIDSFIENFFIVREIVGNHIDFEKFFIQCQNDYIDKWYKNKMSKYNINFYQSWEESELPSNYQNMINFFFSYEINSHYIKEDSKSYIYPIEAINSFNVIEIDNGTIKNIKIEKEILKCNQFSSDIILSSFEILKLFSLFSLSTWDNILITYKNLLSSYAKYQNEQILTAGSQIVVSNKELSMTYSIIKLLKCYRARITKCDSFAIIKKNVTSDAIDAFFALNDLFDNIIHSVRCKIIDLIDIHCIGNSIRQLEEIKLPYYNVVEGEVPVNNYTINLITQLNAIYDSLLYSFEEQFIINTFNLALNKFFEKLENFIFKGEKIEDDACLKQFRKDMIFLKKNLNLGILDVTQFIERIDNILKNVLPESMFKSKKK